MELMSWAAMAGGMLFAALFLLWLLSLLERDAGIVDVFWGLGFAMLVWLGMALRQGNWGFRHIALAALVSLWALRLALHIGVRNSGHDEDFRYRAWREKHGSRWWWRSFLQVFLLQGVILWIVAWPMTFVLAAPSPAPLDLWDVAILGLWLVGFVFEAAGDWQMERFRADPANRGQVMDRGLWRYSRHPNYFGDAVQHWAFWLLAVRVGGWWTVFAPLLMTFLLLRVSGVSLLERSMKETKPKYADYMRRTSAFFPWPPKRSTGRNR